MTQEIAQSPRLCQAVVQPRHSLREAAGSGTASVGSGTAQHILPGSGTSRLGGGTAQCSVSVKLTLAVVPLGPRKPKMRCF